MSPNPDFLLGAARPLPPTLAPGGFRLMWLSRSDPGSGRAPNICSSPPSADDLHVVLQLDVRARRERDRRRAQAQLSRIAQLDQRTALPDQCLHSAEADVRPQPAIVTDQLRRWRPPPCTGWTRERPRRAALGLLGATARHAPKDRRRGPQALSGYDAVPTVIRSRAVVRRDAGKCSLPGPAVLPPHDASNCHQWQRRTNVWRKVTSPAT